jgi:hypothetical protein
MGNAVIMNIIVEDVLIPFQNFALIASVIGFGVAIIAFLILAPWYRTLTGSILLSVLVNFLFVILITAAGSEYHGGGGVEVARSVVFGGTAINGFGLAWTIIRAQLKGRKSHSHHEVQRILFTRGDGKKEREADDVLEGVSPSTIVNDTDEER